MDAAGNLYVPEPGNNRIQKWAPGATAGVTVAGGNGAGSAPAVPSGQVFSLSDGGSVTLTPQVSGDIAGYSWTPAAGLSDTAVPEPVADPRGTTVYTLTVTGSDGCAATGSINVDVYIPLRVPNAFTPNGDGKNDVFYVAGGPPGIVITQFTVFDRRGRRVLIFSTLFSPGRPDRFRGVFLFYFAVMSKKIGRPKQAVRQEKNIGFYLTWEQYAVVQRKAALAGVNISDYMRQVALTAGVKARWTEEERGMVKTLIGMSVDLHRLACAAATPGVFGASSGVSGAGPAAVFGAATPGGSGMEPAAFFGSLRDEMDLIIKNLCHDRQGISNG